MRPARKENDLGCTAQFCGGAFATGSADFERMKSETAIFEIRFTACFYY